MRKFIFIGVGVMLMLIGLIIFFGRAPSHKNKPTVPEPLSSYATSGTYTQFTIQGRVVGNDDYHTIRMTIGQDSRTIEVLRGYDNQLERSQTFDNNEPAYQVFMLSLEHLRFDKSRKFTPDDERGFCVTGNRYIYTLENGSDEVFRTWSTSCSSGQGTFAGSASAVRNLFKAQFGNYSQFTNGVSL